jgi:hypothetical protein
MASRLGARFVRAVQRSQQFRCAPWRGNVVAAQDTASLPRRAGGKVLDHRDASPGTRGVQRMRRADDAGPHDDQAEMPLHACRVACRAPRSRRAGRRFPPHVIML